MTINSLAPNNIALKSVSIMSWFRLAEDGKQQDFELALSLAKNHPELFEVSHEYEFADFQKAIRQVSSPEKTGIVYGKTPLKEDGVWKSEPLEQEISHRRSQDGHCKPATK